MYYGEDVYVDILDEGPVNRDDQDVYKGKGIAESVEFERWEGGSMSCDDESDHYYSRYRNDSKDYGGGRIVKHESAADNYLEEFPNNLKHDAVDKGHSSIARYGGEVDSDAEKELLSRRHAKHASGNKEHKRNYRRRKVVDDNTDEESEEEQFTRKLITHESVDKKHKRNYRRKRVVDDGNSEEEAKAEEQQFTRKIIMHESKDKQHGKHSKRKRVVDDDYSDDDFEFVVKQSTDRDNFGGHDLHCERILSRNHSRSKDEDMSEDHIERERGIIKHRDDSHERKLGHHRSRRVKHCREKREYEDYPKESGRDAEEDKYKRVLRDIHHSSTFVSEHDGEDDNELDKRNYDYIKVRGRHAKEENFNRRRDIHRSTRYKCEHDNDDDLQAAMIETEIDYEYLKERGIDVPEDKYNRRLGGMRHSTRYQFEHDDDDWDREIMEWKRDSSAQSRGKNDNIYEMKPEKKDYNRDFRVHGRESFARTWNRDLIERVKERDLLEHSGECWEESRGTNRRIQIRKLRRENNFDKRDSRMQIGEGREKSQQRELTDGEKEIDLKEQDRLCLEMSLEMDLAVQKSRRDFKIQNRECTGKSQELRLNKESKADSWKWNSTETVTSNRERETTGRNPRREKVHKVIRRKDLTERDVTIIEDSHERERDVEIGEIIPKRHIYESDSKKKDMEGKTPVVREADLEDHSREGGEGSQHIEWYRKTRHKYQKMESMDRDIRDRGGRQHIFEREGVRRLNERLIHEPSKENHEQQQERAFVKEGRETIRRRDFGERDAWKPDIESREKSLEIEVMHTKNERHLMPRDVDMAKRHQNEHLNEIEEKRRKESNKISQKKTLENNYMDIKNGRDILHRDVDNEKNQQTELLSKEEQKHRRDADKISLEKTLENNSVDKDNERKSVVWDSGSGEKHAANIEGESVGELEEEEEKSREQHKEQKDREARSEAGTDSDRKQKTIFTYQVSTEADERDVYNFFSKAGKVRDVRLIMDPISRHFIGAGYVEFYHAISIPIAVSLSGNLLRGQPVMVKPPADDNNQVYSIKGAVEGDPIGPCPGGSNGICVGNLHDRITEALLRQVFGAFGTIELVQFPSAEAGDCERDCNIKFARHEDAMAVLSLNGNLALAGQLIKVSAINDHAEVPVVGATNECNAAECNNLVSVISVQDEMQGGSAKTNDSNEEEANGMAPDGQSEPALEKSNPSGTCQNNALLSSRSPVNVDSPASPLKSLPLYVPPSMQDFTSSLKAVLQVPGAVIPIVDTVGAPSECLLLKNMFDSNTQITDDFELRVKEDIEEKCYKYGKPKEIHIDKNSAGCVYLRFEDIVTAIIAQRALHGRWFAGKIITATYTVPQIFDTKFLTTDQAPALGPPPTTYLPYHYGPSFPISGSEQALAQGPQPPVWLTQTYGSHFSSCQQPMAQGPSSAMWLPNNNPVAFGAGYGGGGQFMLPPMPQSNIFPDARPNIW